MQPVKNHTILVIFVLAISLVYWPSLNVPFLFDDFTSIVDVTDIYEGKLEQLYGQFGSRIFTYFTFKINYLIDGLNPWGYHAVNIFLHALTSFLVYNLTQKLLNRSFVSVELTQIKIAAFLAALIFALHPLHTQAVTYLAQRATVLAALFYILTLVLYFDLRSSWQEKRQWHYIFLITVSFLLAITSKQNAYSLPGAMLLIEGLFFKSKSVKKLLILLLVVMLLIGTYVTINPEFLQTIDQATRETRDFSREAYLESQLHIIPMYVQKFLWPYPLQVEYILPLYSGDFKQSLLPIIAALVLLVMALILRHRNPLVTFAIGFFFISHSVESSIIPISDLAFEHRAYLPDFSLVVLIAGLFVKLQSKKSILLGGLLLSTLSVMTWQRNIVWVDPESLFKAELSINEDKPRVQGFLGEFYQNSGRPDLAADYFLKAYELSGDDSELDNQGQRSKFSFLVNYISSLRSNNQIELALKQAIEFERFINNRYDLALLYANIALLYGDLGDQMSCLTYIGNAQFLMPGIENVDQIRTYCLESE